MAGQTFTLNIKAIADMKDVVSNIQNIQSALSKLKMPDGLKASFDKTFGDLAKETTKYQQLLEKGFKTKGDASAFTKSGDNILRLYDDLVKKINSIDDSALKNMFKDLGTQEIERLKNELNGLQESLKNQLNGKDFAAGFKTSLQEVRNKFKETNKEASDLAAKLQKSTFNTFAKNLTEGRLDLAANNLKSIKEQINALGDAKPAELQQWVEQLDAAFEKLKGDSNIQETVNQLEAIKSKLTGAEAQVIQQMIDGFKNFKGAVAESDKELHKFVADEQQVATNTAAFNKELDQVKSRIQYFLGLNNAINLVKRAIRGAVDTIKDLDKAMTATAVVTDFTVSDMWGQLPEYTKRANELGVTTQAAYEAATLYYQQGLNTEEVNALSVETLKMARIAGLDAAEATDRMTNALRGFNMELTTTNAQRVDDVYSELAANTASNVDEISTAMTKVASLAHSANMEFETTAAFLAQIIETTRESAETAGTALKTVVARFSEVKKLVDTNQLKGQDEEGQIIDVNKVGAALRTAGVDLNKYFLGEVGLDDIFMELASKWDSLSSVQQRYIATQAAGSRQQSRFIALMQDYARTQELVGKAYNSEGASARQFEKTQESLESKLNRLKNAWNEFLMGLANNSIVKTVVDGLTTLLNLVNKLTAGFDQGTSFILKWVAAIGTFAGVKSLFSSGGLIDKGLMTLLAGTGAGNAAVKSGLLSGLVFGGKGKIAAGLTGEAAKNAAAAAAGATATRTPIIFGSGSLLSKAGKGAWASAQSLGSALGFGVKGAGDAWLAEGMTGTSGMVAGLGGVAVALGAVAAAVGVVVAGYQAWLRLTPEGHLKQAKQLAEVMNNVADSTQRNASEFRKATTSYQEYDNAVKSATNIAEYQKAITDRTDYVSELMQSNPNIAKYVKATSEDGHFVLTIDQQDLEKASEEAAKNAAKAAADASFSNALVAGKQADVYEAQLLRAGVNLQRGTITDINTGATRVLTEEEIGKYSVTQRQIEAARAEELSYAQQAFSKQLEGSDLDDDIANLLSSALAKGFSEDEYLSKVNQQRSDNWWSGQATRQELEAQYFALYGQQADASLKRGELARIVAQGQVNFEQQQVTNAVAALVKSGNYNDILKAIAGEIDFSDEDMTVANKRLQEFATALGKDITEVQQQIKISQKQRQEIKKSNQQDIFEQAIRSGRGVDESLFKTIKGLDFEQLDMVSSIITQAADKVGEQTFQSLFDTLPTLSTESLKELQSFFNDFNLDNPIQALSQLNSKINEVGANSPFGKILTDIKTTNKALFTSSNLVQSFLLSESYENLSDSIEKFTKDNKKLTADNIEEMADSCSDLQALLEETDITAQGLAETLNLIGDGSLAIDQITDALLAALSAGESFETLIGNVQKWIKDFDKGTDLTEGTQHITEVLEEAGKYVEGWQFGNEPLMNIYDHIFGEGAYDAYMKENWGKKSFDQLEQELGGEIQRISDMAKDEGLGALQFLSTKNIGITDKGNNEFSWDLNRYKGQENPVQAAIQDVATQLGVTEDAARAFIESWASHMWDLRQEWNDLNFGDAMKAFSEGLGDSAVITESELDALVAKTGKTRDEILAALEDIRGKGNIPIVVSWQDENGANLTGQDLIDKFDKSIGIAQEKTGYRGGGSTLETWTERTGDYSKFISQFSHSFDNVVGPGSKLQQGIDAIDFTALHNHLVEAYKLTPSQADEVANSIVKSTDGKFAQTIKVPIEAEDGSVQMIEKTLTSDTAEGLSAAINAELEAADAALVANKLANMDVSGMGSKVQSTLTSSIQAGANTLPGAVSSAAEGVSVTIPVHWEPDLLPTGTAAATGGIVKSYAQGSENFHVNAGTALTGEEGPELIWNKDKGYAYVTGQEGPEFANLQPGDRIFNASETRRIFANSRANGGLIDSYASGGWKPTASSSKSGGGSSGGGSGSDKDKTPEEWKNDLDWLYNLLEDIAELERDQKAIEEEYEDLLKNQNKTGGDLYRLLVKQLGNLYTQLNHQTFALEKREQEMREFMDITNDKDQYLWYNWQDRTIEIDWDAIDRITDEDEYKHVKELIDEAEEIQDKMDDADDAIMDITNQIQELENIWRDTFTDFEDRVLDAIIKSYQKVIDNYSELNDTLNNSNQQILDSLQKQISLQRQIRDNTKTEEGITDDEARLAYLRRDTTGGNELAAMQLEKELADQRQSYEDSLVDQAVQRLQDDNDAAAQQREHQIEIMQAQLDYQAENGEFNAYVQELLTTAMGADGELLTNSDLVTLLKEQENWDAMSAVSKQVWDEELNGTFKEVAAFLLKQNAEENGTFYTALTAAVNSVSSAIGSYSQAMVKLGNSISSAGSSGGGSSGGGSSSNSGGTTTVNPKTPEAPKVTVTWERPTGVTPNGKYTNWQGSVYATGGLNTQTGLAWLDGTPSEPEYVLNARQTDAFLKLADVLPSMMNNSTASTANTFGATYVNVSVNLESVSPDYDVDRVVDLVKDKLYDVGSYRNVNSLSFIR